MGDLKKKWVGFERLVAAVHKAADEGADVKWNEKIDGRQFDVTLRFRKGLYNYLTVVECKDYAKPVPVGDVDAFVTKSRDLGADRAVMASSGGFQKGAKEVAVRHKIELMEIREATEISFLPFGATWGPDTPALQIESIVLEYKSGMKKELPRESNALEYYANQVEIRSGATTFFLRELVHDTVQNGAPTDQGAEKEIIVELEDGARVVAPDDGEIPLETISRVRIAVKMTIAKTLVGPVKFDPYLLLPDVEVENVSSGETTKFAPAELPLGFDTVFEVGAYYEQPSLGHYFYCDKIDGEAVFIFLIESYQHGMLFQGELVTRKSQVGHFVPVFDEAVLKRLERRLEQLKVKQRKAS